MPYLIFFISNHVLSELEVNFINKSDFGNDPVDSERSRFLQLMDEMINTKNHFTDLSRSV